MDHKILKNLNKVCGFFALHHSALHCISVIFLIINLSAENGDATLAFLGTLCAKSKVDQGVVHMFVFVRIFENIGILAA